MAWMGNNIGGSLKRAVGIAMHVGFGNIGGVIAAFVYQSQHAPRSVSPATLDPLVTQVVLTIPFG